MLFHVASDYAGSAQALGASYKTIIAGLAATATLRRGKITEMAVGPISDPGATDCNIIYTVMRQTANDGTGTSATPNYYPALEAGTPPAVGSTWKANYSGEPTITAGSNLWTKALNQHSAFIWYAPDELGLQWPAVNVNGLACLAKGASASYTGTVLWDVKFEE